MVDFAFGGGSSGGSGFGGSWGDDAFFDRYTKLIIKNPSSETEKTITTDELGIFFRTKRWTSGQESESYGATLDNSINADIGIFNLSDDTIDDIKHEDLRENIIGSTVTLMSGYRNHYGVIFTGRVAHLEKETSGSDVMTLLRCRESRAIVKNAVVNVTYTGGKTLPELVQALAVEAEIPIARIDPKDIIGADRTYAPTKSLDTIFTELAIECGFTYEFKHGALYFLDSANRLQTIYDLTPESGLLSMHLTRDPAYTNDSYDVVTLMLPDIQWLGGVKIGDYICSVTTKPVYTSNGEEHCTKFLATIGQEFGTDMQSVTYRYGGVS